MNKEFQFLNIINNNLDKNLYIGDDCAYLKDIGIAVSSDSLIEDVHFSLDFMNIYQIAQKAMLANISDILASGAKPKYFTINLSGKLNNEIIDEFYKGINDIAKEFDIEIIGGDLTSSEKLTISITAIGLCKNRNISSRKNAKENYIVLTCGEFGTSAQGLEDLINKKENNEFINKHIKPQLNQEVSELIAKNCTHPIAMMDSSDGLVDCLCQISSKSNVRIDINYEKIPHKTKNKKLVLYGGEDYSLVLCIHPDDYNKIKTMTNKLVQIGKCSKGNDLYIDGKLTKINSYFNHFE